MRGNTTECTEEETERMVKKGISVKGNKTECTEEEIRREKKTEIFMR